MWSTRKVLTFQRRGTLLVLYWRRVLSGCCARLLPALPERNTSINISPNISVTWKLSLYQGRSNNISPKKSRIWWSLWNKAVASNITPNILVTSNYIYNKLVTSNISTDRPETERDRNIEVVARMSAQRNHWAVNKKFMGRTNQLISPHYLQSCNAVEPLGSKVHK
jgi:hypothetical protein